MLTVEEILTELPQHMYALNDIDLMTVWNLYDDCFTIINGSYSDM